MKRVLLYVNKNKDPALGEILFLVASGLIPPFDVPPDVIVWGDRYFRYSWTDDEGDDVYVECFAVALVNADPVEWEGL